MTEHGSNGGGEGEGAVKALTKPATTADIVAELRREFDPEQGQVPAPDERTRLLRQVGTVRLTARQKAILRAPVSDDVVDVKPTGEVYVGHVHYRRRLGEAFSGWGLVPLEKPQFSQEGRAIVYREYLLVVNGQAATSPVFGEAEYHPKNKRLTLGDALESARSNAITRSGKDLGMFSEIWDRSWATVWRAKHCVCVWLERDRGRGGDDDEQSNRPVWRRLDATPYRGERAPTDDSPNQAEWVRQQAGLTATRTPGAEADGLVGGPVPFLFTGVRCVREAKGSKAALYVTRTEKGKEYYFSDQELYTAVQALIQGRRGATSVQTEERTGSDGRQYTWLLEVVG